MWRVERIRPHVVYILQYVTEKALDTFETVDKDLKEILPDKFAFYFLCQKEGFVACCVPNNVSWL